MPRMDERPAAVRAVALAAMLLAMLAGCTEPQKPLEQCEPGVSELSDTAALVPGTC